MLRGRSMRIGQRMVQLGSIRWRSDSVTRDVEEVDVVVVGGGPSGLSTAIRLKQLQADLRVVLVEKGAEVGSHIVSGCVMDPRALNELIPDWKSREAPLRQPALKDEFQWMTSATGALRLPTPPQMHNEGSYIVSLSEVCRWLGGVAEEAGVEVYPATAAYALATDPETGAADGIVTGDLGRARDGSEKASYAPGMHLKARVTILAEGARGSLTKATEQQYGLRSSPASFALGVKEVWRVPESQHRPGHIMHSVGWPLESDVYGGSFLYHMDDGLVSLGFAVGLDYKNPYLSPYKEFQRLKHHPLIANVLKGGEPLTYAARVIYEGGLQGQPELVFPGGLIVGDAAGFLNVPRIKGTHTAMKSGMLAAEAAAEALQAGDAASAQKALKTYPERFRASWLHRELHGVRNIRPYFASYGFYGGMALSALDTYVFRGNAPWTLKFPEADHEALQPASGSTKIEYPKPDGVLSFSLLDNLARSGTNHEEDQPVHLQVLDGPRAESVNRDRFDGPESRYCPAGVYEWVDQKLVINAQNCLHCKTCDIKDPSQNINWVPPEGGGGPLYSNA